MVVNGGEGTGNTESMDERVKACRAKKADKGRRALTHGARVAIRYSYRSGGNFGA